MINEALPCICQIYSYPNRLDTGTPVSFDNVVGCRHIFKYNYKYKMLKSKVKMFFFGLYIFVKMSFTYVHYYFSPSIVHL